MATAGVGEGRVLGVAVGRASIVGEGVFAGGDGEAVGTPVPDGSRVGSEVGKLKPGVAAGVELGVPRQASPSTTTTRQLRRKGIRLIQTQLRGSREC